MRMMIATFNVNGHQQAPARANALAGQRPAGCGLPAGTQAASVRFPEAAIREVGYGAIWHGQKSWNGLILARGAEPIETSRGLQGDPDNAYSRYTDL